MFANTKKLVDGQLNLLKRPTFQISVRFYQRTERSVQLTVFSDLFKIPFFNDLNLINKIFQKRLALLKRGSQLFHIQIDGKIRMWRTKTLKRLKIQQQKNTKMNTLFLVSFMLFSAENKRKSRSFVLKHVRSFFFMNDQYRSLTILK